MYIIEHRAWFYWISAVLVAAAVVSVVVFRIPLAIDFTGGTLLEVAYSQDRPDKSALEDSLRNSGITSFSLRPVGEEGYLLRTKELTEETRAAAQQALSLNGAVEAVVTRATTVGPTVGGELANKAIVALSLVALMIVLYVAFAFRKVSEPISSWYYGLITIVSLLHDVLIPVGVFALLGHFAGVEIDILFVMALLTILGYSVNDTIVVFDRVRENLAANKAQEIVEPFAEVVGRSLRQTLARSINTSLTTMLAVGALYIFGGDSTRYFALALLLGVAAGAYSSVFIASPLLVSIAQWKAARPTNAG